MQTQYQTKYNDYFGEMFFLLKMICLQLLDEQSQVNQTYTYIENDNAINTVSNHVFIMFISVSCSCQSFHVEFSSACSACSCSYVH